MKPRRALFVVLGLGLAATIAFFMRDPPVRADVATVTRGPLRVVLEEEGRTRVRERYVVSSPLAGIMQRIALDAGDHVEAGAIVAAIAPTGAVLLDPATRARATADVEAATRSAEAARSRADAAAAASRRAQREAARIEKLPTTMRAAADLDGAREAVAFAKAELAAAQLEAEAAERRIVATRALLDAEGKTGMREPIPVVAPSGGVVLRLLQESEASIVPGMPLVEIGDPTDIEVEVEALTQDAVRLKPGSPARIVRWGGAPLEAHVDRIEPGGFTKTSALGVEEQRVRVICRIDSPRAAWATLGDGYRVEVEITVEQLADAVLAPATATFRERGEWAVYVVEDGRARLRRVAIAQRAGATVAVESGLREGERVVAFPDDETGEGTRIEPLPGD